MSITRRLQVALLAMVALVVIAAATALVTITVVTQSQQSKADRIAKLLVGTAQLRVNVAGEIDSLRAELVARSGGAVISKDLTQYAPLTKGILADLRVDAAGSPAVLKLLDEIKLKVTNSDALARTTVAEARKGLTTEAQYDFAANVEPAWALLNASLYRLDKEENTFRAQERSQAKRSADTALGILIVVLGGVIAICVYMAIYYPRMVARRLRGVVERLQGTVAHLQGAAEQLSGAAVETATAVRQTAATAGQVERASRVTSEKAGNVASNAKADVESLTVALDASAATAMGMKEIRGQMGVVARSVGDLTEQLQSATAVIDASSDIAEQSNVLAVNAAIEAAREAEHSKGFGVVAEEMRNLANQSKSAVVQVRQIIGEIRKAAGGVVEAAESTNNAVEQGMQQVAESEGAMQSVVRGTSGTVEGMTHISAAAGQQLVGVEQIVESFTSIDTASSQIASSAREVRGHASELENIAEELRTMTEHRQATADVGPLVVEALAEG